MLCTFYSMITINVLLKFTIVCVKCIVNFNAAVFTKQFQISIFFLAKRMELIEQIWKLKWLQFTNKIYDYEPNIIWLHFWFFVTFAVSNSLQFSFMWHMTHLWAYHLFLSTLLREIRWNQIEFEQNFECLMSIRFSSFQLEDDSIYTSVSITAQLHRIVVFESFEAKEPPTKWYVLPISTYSIQWIDKIRYC